MAAAPETLRPSTSRAPPSKVIMTRVDSGGRRVLPSACATQIRSPSGMRRVETRSRRKSWQCWQRVTAHLALAALAVAGVGGGVHPWPVMGHNALGEPAV
eukprot:5133129-Lingulodinium_polyedra.AAC.1